MQKDIDKWTEQKKREAEKKMGEHHRTQKKEHPKKPYGEMEVIKKDFKKLTRAFLPTVKSYILSGKREAIYHSADEFCKKTNLNADLLRTLLQYGGAEKRDEEICITYVSLKSFMEEYSRLIYQLGRFDELKTEQLEEGKKERENLKSELKKEKEELKSELKKEKEEQKILETTLKKQQEMRKRLKAKLHKEKVERKKLEALLRREEAVGGRPKAKVDTEELRTLLDLGWSRRSIAKKFGVSHTTILRRLRELQHT